MFVMSSWFVVVFKSFFLDNLLSSYSVPCLSSYVSNYYSQFFYFSLKSWVLFFASWAWGTVARYIRIWLLYLPEESAFQCKRCGFNSWVRKIFWRRQWHPTPVLLPGKSHGQRSLVGCRPRGHQKSDTTERLHFHFSLSCTGEGNGNPLQYSCLGNPMDRGAWWAAGHWVTKSWTQLSY